jgi:hypothetical protein
MQNQMIPNNSQPDEGTSSELPSKKDLDQLYSALRYKAKNGDANPLDKYSQLTNTRGENHDFWKKFKADKAFNFVKVQYENSVIRGSDVAQLEGWMTKFQFPDWRP